MNICLVSIGFTPEDGGGIGTYIINLAKGLRRLGHNIFVITRTYGGDKAEIIDGVRVYRYRSRYIPKLEKLLPNLEWSRFVSGKIEALDREFGLDIIEFPNWEGVGFWYGGKKKRKPVVTRFHTPYFEMLTYDSRTQKVTMGDKFLCWLEKRASLSADAMVCSTRFHADFMIKSYGLEKNAIHILPLGIELCAPPAGYGSRNDPLKILYVGRLEHRKGTMSLIRAIPQVCAEAGNVQFLIAGKDRAHAPGGILHQEYFRRHYSQYGGKVKFLGFVADEEVRRLYADCDIFAAPSLYESFGLIYVEAMMNGKPVIGCRAGGIPEVVDHGESGFLIEPDDDKALARRIIELARDYDLRVAMGKKARKLCEERFSFDIMAKNTETFYKQVAGEHARKT